MNFEKGNIVKVTNTTLATNYKAEEQNLTNYGVVINSKEDKNGILMIINSRRSLRIKKRYYKLLKKEFHAYYNLGDELLIDLKTMYITDEDLISVGRINNIDKINEIEEEFINYEESPMVKKYVISNR